MSCIHGILFRVRFGSMMFHGLGFKVDDLNVMIITDTVMKRHYWITGGRG